MKPYKISVMGDDFFLFSLKNPAEQIEDYLSETANAAVLLLPSVAADFSIKAYSKGGNPLSDYYAAAVSAAAFLVSKRGLPLSEILFETPKGNIEVFCTGNGLYTVLIPKCKYLSTNIAEVMGCEIEYSDICVGSLCRVLNTKSIDDFDIKCLPLFVASGNNLPSAVLLSETNGEIRIVSYTDFNSSPPSSISLFSAAAYRACVAGGLSLGREFTLRDKNATCRVGYFCVSVTMRPIIEG